MIRKDVYSIKVYEPFIGIWCHVFMTRSLTEANRKASEIRNERSRAKLVHPADWVVSAFVAAGNLIT